MTEKPLSKVFESRLAEGHYLTHYSLDLHKDLSPITATRCSILGHRGSSEGLCEMADNP